MGRKKLSESNPRKNEREIGKSTIDRIVRKPTFNFYDRPQVGARFFIFKNRGDQLEGQIIGRSIVNVRRSSSWPIRLDTGEIVEVFGNKTLHNQLKDAGIYSRVRIVYVGIEQTQFGHPKKIFRVYQIKE